MMNIEIEKCILGLILLEENLSSLDTVTIKPEYFSNKANREIFSSLCNMNKDGMHIDVLSLVEYVKMHKKLEECNGVAYITSLLTFATTTGSLSYYVETLHELYLKRTAALELVKISNDLNTEKLSTITQKLINLQQSLSLQSNYEQSICDISEIELKETEMVLQTGFYKLDKAIQGLEAGTLSVFTGEPGSGKTTIMNQIIANILKDGHKAFLYSGELAHSKIKTWLFQTLALEQNLNPLFNDLGEFEMKPSDEFIKKANCWIKDKLFLMKESQSLSTNNLRDILVFLNKTKGINLFVLDNLMSLVSGGNEDQLILQRQVVSELKQIARELNVVIILVAHPNKESIKTGVQNMFSVAGASEIVNLADYVFKLVPDEDETLLYVLKNRISGNKNIYLSLKFDRNRKRFYSSTKAELYQKYV